MREDKEIREFRDLMKPPDEFESGFNWGTILMAVFVGLVMAPANLYMGLVAGMGIGGAANWVTVILYVEIARRAFKRLRRPEIFVLFYMCGAVMATGGQGLLWKQFFVQSEEVSKLGLARQIPTWYAPSDPDILSERTFLHRAWALPLGLSLLGAVFGVVDRFGLGYVMFRLTSDVEKLPFPLAPVGAMGMTALADASSQRETWRWRTFAMGAVGGIAFGSIYVVVPSVTGALFDKPLHVLPMPFVDLTGYTERILPAMPVMVSFNVGLFITGMVIPFWSAMGMLAGLVITLAANPFLYHVGILDGWEEGIGAIQTIQSNTMDFYFSFGIGLAFAVAAIGFFHVFNSFRQKREEMDEMGKEGMKWHRLFQPPPGRGDVPLWLGVLIYLVSTSTYIALAYWLVNYASGPLKGSMFPLWLLIFYGFVYTPVISYISARMEGIVGRQVAIPYVREATFILSGYKGAAIWFAPIPLHNYTGQVVSFRQMELTGTRFTSLMKAEVLIFPVTFLGTILFSQFILSMGPVPSEMYPYANKFWELQAYQGSLMYTATLGGETASPFREAFRPDYIGIGFTLALSVYILLDRFGFPVFLVYGVVGGLSQSEPSNIVPMVLGAFFGRYVCRKRFGADWPKYRVVFAAGFGAGMGLIAMFGMGFVLMAKSVIRLPV